MGVDLRGTDIGVPEKFLHAAQVPARLEQVSGKGMTKQVRMGLDPDPGTTRPVIDPELHGARADALSVASYEKSRLVDGGDRCALLEPRADRIDRKAANRQHTLLAALASDPQGPIGEIEIGEIERDQLLQAQAGRIKELHHRLVANADALRSAKIEELR